MKRTWIAVLAILFTIPAFAQKADKRLADSTAVLKELISNDQIPTRLLNRARCVMVYPSVKKVAIGIGGTYGRGVLVCRTGTEMSGRWGAPVMYTLDTGSLGVQLGSTATDYVLLVLSKRGADKVLSGKLKLGAGASAVAGPSAAQASGFNDTNIDIVTYARTKGLFAGASLGEASMSSDDSINKELYGKDITPTEIMAPKTPVPPAAQPLVSELQRVSPKHV